MKWRWFERYWQSHNSWIVEAKCIVKEPWSEYKDKPVRGSTNTTSAVFIDEDNEWMNEGDAVAMDRLWLYEQEPYTQIWVKDLPIPYWTSKRDATPSGYSIGVASSNPEPEAASCWTSLVACRSA